METWKKILRAYMHHIIVEEGGSFITRSEFKSLSDAEYDLMSETYYEVLEEQKSQIEGGA